MKKIISLISAISIIIGMMGVTSVYADQLDSGVYNFECVAGGRYLNVYAGYDYDGANVCVWSKDGSSEQNFKLTDRGGNRYVLTPQSSKSGRVLDANRGNSYNNPLRAGNNIDIWQTNDQPAQEWYIDDRGNGCYTIELVNARGLVVTCDNPWGNNGNCTLQQYNGSSNQLWKLHKVGGGSTQSVSSSSNTSGYKTGTYKVKYQGTNVRSGAGLGYNVVTTVNSGRQVNVTQVNGEWGYIPSLGGWLRLNGFADYVGGNSTSSSSTTQTQSSNQANLIVSKAASHIGYVETTYSSGAFWSKFGSWYGTQVGNSSFAYSPWCAMFVSHCATEAGVDRNTIPLFASCGVGVNWFKNNGTWHSRNGYAPKKGDIIFFTSNGYSPTHVGIVESVSGGNVYTIEGNVHDGSGNNYGVRRLSYSTGNSKILGYGSPNYK